MPATIDPIAGTNMDAQLDDAIADWLAVAKIAGFDLSQAHADARGSNFVAETQKPIREWLPSVVTLISKQVDQTECSLKATYGPGPSVNVR